MNPLDGLTADAWHPTYGKAIGALIVSAGAALVLFALIGSTLVSPRPVPALENCAVDVLTPACAEALPKGLRELPPPEVVANVTTQRWLTPRRLMDDLGRGRGVIERIYVEPTQGPVPTPDRVGPHLHYLERQAETEWVATDWRVWDPATLDHLTRPTPAGLEGVLQNLGTNGEAARAAAKLREVEPVYQQHRDDVLARELTVREATLRPLWTRVQARAEQEHAAAEQRRAAAWVASPFGVLLVLIALFATQLGRRRRPLVVRLTPNALYVDGVCHPLDEPGPWRRNDRDWARLVLPDGYQLKHGERIALEAALNKALDAAAAAEVRDVDRQAMAAFVQQSR